MVYGQCGYEMCAGSYWFTILGLGDFKPAISRGVRTRGMEFIRKFMPIKSNSNLKNPCP